MARSKRNVGAIAPAFSLIVGDEDFPCAYRGMVGVVTSETETHINTVLNCGHVYVITKITKEMDKSMAKGKQKALILGYEQAASDFAVSKRQFDILSEKLDELKGVFRDAVRKISLTSEAKYSFAFAGTNEGDVVEVAVPDPSKIANRVNLKDELLSTVVELYGKDAVESTTTITLTGDWVPWMLALRKQWMDSNANIPSEGFKVAEVSKLSDEGVSRVISAAKHGDKRAQVILSDGLKAPSVK